KCVAVFPSLTKAALLVGAQHGDGVATCRDTQGRWSQIAFLDLVGASFGAQLGIQSTDLVMFFTEDDAVEELKEGEFTLGADASVTMGATDRSVKVDSDMGEIVAFSKSGGGFIGASLEGTVLRVDQDELEQFYNEETVTVARVLESYDDTEKPEV